MMAKFFSTMSTRIFLILIAGITITASIVNILNERANSITESRMFGHFAYERVENAIRILDATVPKMRAEVQETLSQMGSRVTLNVPAPSSLPTASPEIKALSEQLVPSLADKVTLIHGDECQLARLHRPLKSSPATVIQPKTMGRVGEPPSPPDFPQLPEVNDPQCLAVYAHLTDGTPLLVHLYYGRPPMPKNGQEPFNLVLAALGLIFITWLVANIATKPLRKLAQAALQLAKNIEHPPLPENQGSIEVRKAASAFNSMQRNIRKHLQERAFILGAISHDLQTPLTRLRLRLEKVNEPTLKQQLIKDLTATHEMIHEGLDFARLCSEHLQKSKINFSALVNAICDDFAENGQIIECKLPSAPIYIMGSQHLLKRCLNNLLNNALIYGKNPVLEIEIKKIELTKKILFCTVTDDGPGVPESELETILEPFRRLEDSRSRHTGGTGLGLSIARMIVEKHDGRIYLNNKKPPSTGLIITIELPI